MHLYLNKRCICSICNEKNNHSSKIKFLALSKIYVGKILLKVDQNSKSNI